MRWLVSYVEQDDGLRKGMHAPGTLCLSSELLPWSFICIWLLLIISWLQDIHSCLWRRDKRGSGLKFGDVLRAFLNEDGSTACDTFKCLCLSGSWPKDF